MDRSEAGEFVQRWANAWSTPMRSAELAALYTDDASTGGSIRPPSEFTQESFDGADKMWTGKTLVEKWYLADEDRIVVHWCFEGVHDGEQFDYPGLAVLSMREGKCFLEEHYGSDLRLPPEIQKTAARSRGVPERGQSDA